MQNDIHSSENLYSCTYNHVEYYSPYLAGNTIVLELNVYRAYCSIKKFENST